jgi:hypothetical protein
MTSYGLSCVPTNALDFLRPGESSLNNYTLNTRGTEKDVELSKQGNFGKLSSTPRYRLELPTCFTRTHVIENQTSSIWEQLNQVTYALKSSNTPLLTKLQYATSPLFPYLLLSIGKILLLTLQNL